MKSTFGIFLVSLLVTVTTEASINLVINGSFEEASGAANDSGTGGWWLKYNAGNTAISGWTVDSGSVDRVTRVSSSGWNATDGAWSLDLFGTEAGQISQVLQTQAGQQYRLSFAMAGNDVSDSADKTLSLSVALVALGQQSGSLDQTFTWSGPHGIDANGNISWVQHELLFTAYSDTTVLTFADLTVPATGKNSGAALDNIVLTAVPEASTYFAGLGAILMLGLSAWKARRQTTMIA